MRRPSRTTTNECYRRRHATCHASVTMPRASRVATQPDGQRGRPAEAKATGEALTPRRGAHPRQGLAGIYHASPVAVSRQPGNDETEKRPPRPCGALGGAQATGKGRLSETFVPASQLRTHDAPSAQPLDNETSAGRGLGRALGTQRRQRSRAGVISTVGADRGGESPSNSPFGESAGSPQEVRTFQRLPTAPETFPHVRRMQSPTPNGTHHAGSIPGLQTSPSAPRPLTCTFMILTAPVLRLISAGS